MSHIDTALAAVRDAGQHPGRHRAAVCDEFDLRGGHLAAFRRLETRSDAAILASTRSHFQLAVGAIDSDLVATRKFLVDAGAELAELVRRVDQRQAEIDAAGTPANDREAHHG